MNRQKIFLIALVLIVMSAISLEAAETTWQSIALEGAGKISLPDFWRVKNSAHSVLENAYGPGISRSTLLEAEGSDEQTITVLRYWPSGSITTEKFARDLAESLKVQVGSSSLIRTGDIMFGGLKAISLTYRVSPKYDQKLTAFSKAGSLYCFILNYKSSDEREILSLTRQIIKRWEF